MIQPKKPFPIARVSGMLSACAVTLIGVVAGLSPEIILIRVILATVTIVLITYITGKLLAVMMT